jgi:hypothetical protein
MKGNGLNKLRPVTSPRLAKLEKFSTQLRRVKKDNDHER